MKFNVEVFQNTREEIQPLIEKHWREVAHYQDIPLSVDWEGYKRVEDAGALRFYTVRTDEDELIGYCVYFVKHNLHYQESLQASQDIIFIAKEHRGQGAKFIQWCDEQLKADGVQAVYQHVKSAHNFGPMLERIGYQLVDLIYAKRLD